MTFPTIAYPLFPKSELYIIASRLADGPSCENESVVLVDSHLGKVIRLSISIANEK